MQSTYPVQVKGLIMTPYRLRADGTAAEFQLTTADGQKFFIGADENGSYFADQFAAIWHRWQLYVLSLIESPKPELLSITLKIEAEMPNGAWQLVIFTDGERAGRATRDSHGAPIKFHFLSHWEEQRVVAYAQSLPAYKDPGYPNPLPMGLELYISCLYAATAERRDLERICASGVAFQIEGDPIGTWRVMACLRFEENTGELLRAKHPTLKRIANEEIMKPLNIYPATP